jgi:hypothetical protein
MVLKCDIKQYSLLKIVFIDYKYRVNMIKKEIVLITSHNDIDSVTVSM